MSGVHIKGSVLKSRLAFVQDLAPDGGAERVLGRLSAQEQSELCSLLATKWYPFELGQHLDEAIVAELGRGQAGFFERLGSASADKNLTGVHKHFLVAGNPHAFLERTPMICSLLLRQGPSRVPEDRSDRGRPDDLRRGELQRSRLRHGRGLARAGAGNARRPEPAGRRGRVSGSRREVCRYRLSWS